MTPSPLTLVGPSSTEAVTIVALGPEDWPAAFAHGAAFHRLRGLPGAFDAQRARDTWAGITSVMPTILLAGVREGEILGGIGMLRVQDEWSDWVYGAEAFYFMVQPTPGLAVRLLEAAEQWVAGLGLTDCRLAAFHQEDYPLLARFYRQHGYHPSSTTFRKEL